MARPTTISDERILEAARAVFLEDGVAATTAEQIYNDLQFRLARDLRANDAESLRETIAQIVAVVPDEHHPMRVQLEQYLRDHPLPQKK